MAAVMINDAMIAEVEAQERTEAAKQLTSGRNLFVTEGLAGLVGAQPTASFGDISKQLAQQWSDLSEGDRQVYEERALERARGAKGDAQAPDSERSDKKRVHETNVDLQSLEPARKASKKYLKMFTVEDMPQPPDANARVLMMVLMPPEKDRTPGWENAVEPRPMRYYDVPGGSIEECAWLRIVTNHGVYGDLSQYYAYPFMSEEQAAFELHYRRSKYDKDYGPGAAEVVYSMADKFVDWFTERFKDFEISLQQRRPLSQYAQLFDFGYAPTWHYEG